MDCAFARVRILRIPQDEAHGNEDSKDQCTPHQRAKKKGAEDEKIEVRASRDDAAANARSGHCDSDGNDCTEGKTAHHHHEKASGNVTLVAWRLDRQFAEDRPVCHTDVELVVTQTFDFLDDGNRALM